MNIVLLFIFTKYLKFSQFDTNTFKTEFLRISQVWLPVYIDFINIL